MTLDLSSMLPHDHPMILVDRLLSSDDLSAVIEATIRDEYPFTSGAIGTWVGLEFMAQAAAILAKISGPHEERAKLGFLLGSRKFTAHTPEFIPGQKVLIAVHLDPDNLGGPMVNAMGFIRNESGALLCEASLTLYEPNNDALYLTQ